MYQAIAARDFANVDDGSRKQQLQHLVLQCSAINHIDASALESLEAIHARLRDAGVRLHLSEVKGPVMDRLKRSHFLQELTGKVHLTQFDAVASIQPELASATLKDRNSSSIWATGPSM